MFMHKDIANRSGPGPIKIVGFGNKFMGDDGVGIRVIEELQKLSSLKNIELIDGGTSGVDLIPILQNSHAVILIDAVNGGQEVGELITIRPDDLKECISHKINSYSLHDFDLNQVLDLVRALGLSEKLTILGVKPKKIDYCDGLSPEIEKRIPEIISAVKKLAGVKP